MDLHSILGGDLAWFELVARASIVYWSVFVLFRVVLRRDSGSITIADVLFLVLIGDALQNAMIGNSVTIRDGLIVVGTMAAWNWVLDWLAFRYRSVEKLLMPRPVVLVKNGRELKLNMRKELVSHEELMSKLRQQGIEQIEQVKLAIMESDGNVSVIEQSK